jgi:protein-disulfide isomerase
MLDSARNAVIALLVWLLAAPAAAQPIPWNKLRGSDDLMDNEREDVVAVMRRVKSYGRCRGSIARCLAQRPRAPLAWRLANYLVYIAGKGLSRKEMTDLLELRRKSAVPKKVQRIGVAHGARRGATEARVLLVEYADFQCGHCATVAPVLARVVERHKEKVALLFKPYPLRGGGPLLAALASLAAQRQGKFWKMHDLLFENPDRHDAKGIEALARQAGLDLQRFRRDLKDKKLAATIDAIKVEGLRLGLKGTPTLFVNGKLYQMVKNQRHLDERVADELDLLAAQKAAPPARQARRKRP